MNPKNRNENRRGSFPVSNNRRPLAVNFVNFGRRKSQDPAVRKGTFGIRFLGGKHAGRIPESERDGDESAVRSLCRVCCCGGMGPIQLRPRL
jgi:hypothetical protein